MTKTKKTAVSMLFVLLALAVCLKFHAAPAHADGYTLNATLNPTSSAYPGVYYVKAVPGDSNATIGIPSLDKNTLNAPTTESPAIIMGAAVPYEVKTGPTSFTPLSGGALYPPYSYFRYDIISEQGADGTWHQKMSGFDGSYFIGGLNSHLRNLLISKDASTVSLLETSDEIRQQYLTQAQKCDVRFLYGAMRKCTDCDLNYKNSQNRRLLIELTLIEISQLAEGDTVSPK